MIVTKRNVATLEGFKLEKKIEITTDNKKASEKADLIVVAVKAGDAKHVLHEIAAFAPGKNHHFSHGGHFDKEPPKYIAGFQDSARDAEHRGDDRRIYDCIFTGFEVNQK